MDIIQVYNPANENITDEEIAAMKDLGDEQIAELAKAYPNTPRGNAYLVYFNTNEDLKNQRYPLGTWANLFNLRRLGQKHILPFNFFKKFSRQKFELLKAAPKRTVDLSKEDIEGAPGFKTFKLPSEAKTVDAGAGTANTVSNPKLVELEKQLAQAKADKAHHMTIKKLENEIAALK